MSTYNKTVWQDGDIITADKMNNIENGIYSYNEDIANLNTIINGAGEVTLTNLFEGVTPHESSVTSNGVSFAYNSARTAIHMEGTSTGLANIKQYYNLNALPSYLAVDDYVVEFEPEQEGVTIYFLLYNGSSNYQTFTFPNRVGSNVLTIDSQCTGIIIRYQVASGTTINADVPAAKLYLKSEYDDYYDPSSEHDGLVNKVTDLETDMTSVKSRLSSAESSLTSLSGLPTTVSGLSSSVSGMSSKVDELDATINGSELTDLFEGVEPYQTSVTSNGISFAFSADYKTIHMEGTSTGLANIKHWYTTTALPSYLSAGEYVVEFEPEQSGVQILFLLYHGSTNDSTFAFPNSAGNTTLTIDSECTGLIIRYQVASGTTVDADITAAKLYLKSQYDGATGGGLVHDVAELQDDVSALESRVDNLPDVSSDIAEIDAILNGADPTDIFASVTPAETTVTSNGVSFAYNADRTAIHMEGTSTGIANIKVWNQYTQMPSWLTAGDYIVDFDPNNDNVKIYFLLYNGSSNYSTSIYPNNAGNNVLTIGSQCTGLIIRYQVTSGATVNADIPRAKLYAEDDTSNTGLVGDVEALKEEVFSGETAPAPMLTIIDDDGAAKFFYYIFPLYQEMSVPITTAVSNDKLVNIESREPTVNGYMSWTEVAECYRAGLEVVSHTYYHRPSADTEEMTEAEITKEYQSSKNDLLYHGIDTDVLVYDGDTGSIQKCKNACEKVFKCGIHSGGNTINQKGVLDPYFIKRYNATFTAENKALLKGYIDTLAAADTGWMIWMMHTSSTFDSTYVDVLEEILQYALDSGVNIVPVKYALKHYL